MQRRQISLDVGVGPSQVCEEARRAPEACGLLHLVPYRARRAQEQSSRLQPVAAPLGRFDGRGEQRRVIGDQIEGPLEPPGGLLGIGRSEQGGLRAQRLGALRGRGEHLLFPFVERDRAIDQADAGEEPARGLQIGPVRRVEPEGVLEGDGRAARVAELLGEDAADGVVHGRRLRPRAEGARLAIELGQGGGGGRDLRLARRRPPGGGSCLGRYGLFQVPDPFS